MIPTRVHGVLDYLTAAVLILAPFVVGFADGGAAQWVPIVIGAATIVASLLTRYELGVAPVIPMPVHLMLDVAMGVVLLASPWLFGFSDLIWWPHVLFGIIYIVVPMLSARRPAETQGVSVT